MKLSSKECNSSQKEKKKERERKECISKQTDDGNNKTKEKSNVLRHNACEVRTRPVM